MFEMKPTGENMKITRRILDPEFKVSGKLLSLSNLKIKPKKKLPGVNWN